MSRDGKIPPCGHAGKLQHGRVLHPRAGLGGFPSPGGQGQGGQTGLPLRSQREIEIRDAKNIWGKTTTEAQWAIREELGDDDVKSSSSVRQVKTWSGLPMS